MRVMNSTLKRKKSIDSQAASISAWCAVFDWPSIVAAFSVSRHGPGEQLGGAQEDGGALLPRPARPVLPRGRGGVDRLLHVLGAALVDVGEHVLLVVRHHGLLQVAGRDVLAADHERDLDPLVAHLLEAQLQAGALRAAGREAEDRLVDGGRRAEDGVCAHGTYLRRRPRSAPQEVGRGDERPRP